MDIISMTITGNLTADCVVKTFEDKAVINFTVASNLDKDNTIFSNCSYWIKKKEALEDDKKSIEDYLKKGTKVTVLSNYMKTNNSTDAEGKIYKATNITVSKISIT